MAAAAELGPPVPLPTALPPLPLPLAAPLVDDEAHFHCWAAAAAAAAADAVGVVDAVEEAAETGAEAAPLV